MKINDALPPLYCPCNLIAWLRSINPRFRHTRGTCARVGYAIWIPWFQLHDLDAGSTASREDVPEVRQRTVARGLTTRPRLLSPDQTTADRRRPQ